ncbi:MAG: VCBS repeat-containing protein [Acidobacteria bacterium]|nr:VCBS repeat-containing protein [Acidobacteriota bacterium]
MTTKRIRFAFILLILTALVPLRVAYLQPPTAPQAEIDRRKLEELEDKSEDVANGLLELAVALRNGETGKVAAYFADPAQTTPLPTAPTTATPQVKWVQQHGWNFEPKKAVVTTRTALANQWDRLLDNFSEVEDIRFKLRASSFDETGRVMNATVAFWLVGRNAQGHRAWLRATAETVLNFDTTDKLTGGIPNSLSHEKGRWLIREFAIQPINSLIATQDLFSEVSAPAGVAERLPAYGETGNTGFVWRGAAAGDFNRDGWMDLIVTGATRNYLYLNDRQGKFRDASDEVGIRLFESGAGPLVLDYDNDGDTDIFMANVGQQLLFENRLVPDGKLTFNDVSLQAGVAVDGFGFSAATADVNGDGWLDVYVASYNRYGQVIPDSWFRATNGTPNLLFINQRDGTFSEAARKWGLDDRRWSYAATFADINGDHRPDLFVANDFGEKGMFVNRGDHFTDEAAARGLLDLGNGMGVMFGDYNNDGRLDIHATNMSSTAGNRIVSRLFPNQGAQQNVYKKLASGNNLFENLGDGKFKDVTAAIGGLSGMWAWGGGFIDIDGDGWEDIFTPNGFISGKSMADT